MKSIAPSFLAAALICVEAASTQASPVFVNHAATGNNDGSSWTHAYTDLPSALTSSTSGDQIWVAAGTYYPTTGDDRSATFQLKSGLAVYGGFSGSETSLHQRNTDPATSGTILSGDIGIPGDPADNSYHVVNGSGANGSAVLDGFTISGGNADGADMDSRGGGLICWLAGSPAIANCAFTGNEAGRGGAIANRSAHPTIARCAFTDNSAGRGAAIYSEVDSEPWISDSSFTSNSAAGDGGAIYHIGSLTASSGATIANCIFSGNEAENGGALHQDGSFLSVVDCLFSENSGGFGGAVFQTTADGDYINCSFIGNRGFRGGAMTLSDCSGTRLINCSFSGNSVSASGGACYITNFSFPQLINCSISGNSAELSGGGMFVDSGTAPEISNSLIWYNQLGGVGNIPGSSVQESVGSDSLYSHCLIQNYSDTELDASGGAGNLDGTNASNAPQFVRDPDSGDGDWSPLAGNDYGDLRLLSGSPGLDAGSDPFNDTTIDLAGNPRFFGAIDLGAHEGAYTTFALSYPALDPEADENGNRLTNFHDYSAGADPTASPDSSVLPGIDSNRQLTFNRRLYAADVRSSFQKSTNLADWTPMLEGSDYSVLSTTSTDQKQRLTLELLRDPAQQRLIFFRERFSSLE